MTSFDKVIPSGQEGKVTLKVKAKQSRGGKLSKSATVHSNDPKNPTLRLTLTGKVKTFISVEPSNRVYLNGYEGDVISKSLKIINQVKSPLKITELKSNIDDKINYELKPVVEGKEFELTVKTLAGLKGRSNGLITLETNIDKKPKIEIRVSVNFKDDLTVSPNVIHFGRIAITTKPGKTPAKLNLKRNITFKKERGDPVKIQKIVPSSDLIKTSIETREEGKLYKISVSLNKEKLQTGKIEETLEIHTDYKKKPVIKISVRGTVI